VIAQVGSQTYHVTFRHREFPFARCKRPTRRQLMTTLSMAGAVLGGFVSQEAIKAGGFDVQELVGEALSGFVSEDLKFSHQSECLIRDDRGNLVSSGAAMCDKRDQFERTTGRALSFIKAVSAFPPRDYETFFAAYRASGMGQPSAHKLLQNVTDEFRGLAEQFTQLKEAA
jgi:hypothetical protein